MAKIEAHILILDDDNDVLTSAKLLLKQFYEKVTVTNSPTNVISLIQNDPVDVLLLDMNYKRGENDGVEGLNWLKRIKEYDGNIVIIPMTAYADIELAVAAVKKGATDFITKPWQNDKLLATIGAAIQIRKSKLEIDVLKAQRQQIQKDVEQSFGEFIGESESINAIKQTIAQVAKTEANILITGANGTGKEVVARAIHHASLRYNGPFVSIDLGAIPDSLFESELFGHKKGAFTDAKADKLGRFKLAHGGTLFLDEIGNLSPSSQSKLLSVLQNKKVTPVGGSKEENIDVRIISATNENLEDAIKAGKFRTDLYYRFNTVEIKLPALKARGKDIILLAEHFLKLYTLKYHKGRLSLTKSQHLKLLDHEWPGNIRELQHTIERAVILSENGILNFNGITTKENNDEESLPEKLNLDQIEKQTIIKALEKYQGNISQTAKVLGLTRAALYRRLEKHGL